MSEQLTLTTPIVETKTTSGYVVVSLTMDVERIGPSPNFADPIPNPLPPLPPPGVVSIGVRNNVGVLQTFQFFGILAQDMIKFINTGDFTVRSLHKRILEKLIAIGSIPGSVTGTPDAPSGAPTGLE